MTVARAYYNENEPFAAQWLRNLIAAGHIMDGEVDDRSIEDVQADDLRGFAQCHFFAGIGVWSYALRLAGWPSERPIWTGSCPCQPFSVAGSRKGTADKRHLWPVWFRLISECAPPVILGEQVASAAALGWFDTVSDDLEGKGYAVGASDLCAASVGAPHIRQRLYWMANASEIRRERPLHEESRRCNANASHGTYLGYSCMVVRRDRHGTGRPLEPGITPLAPRDSKGMAAIGAISNSIVAPLAAEFARVAMEVLPC